MIFATKDYRDFVERMLNEQRADFERQLAEKSLQIRMLRVELAAVKTQASVEFKDGDVAKRPALIPVVTLPEDPQDWQGELNRLLKEEEDGIRTRGLQEHEPRTDEGA